MKRRHFLLGTGAALVVAGGAVTMPMIFRPGELFATFPRADPVKGDAALPASADAVIIGAGITGIATAYLLAERGLSVVVVEKGEVAGEQSSRAYGQVTNYGQPAVLTEIGQHSKRLWSGMNAKLGADTTYRGYGRVEVLADDEAIEKARKWLDEASPYAPDDAPLNARFVEGEELAQLIPGATGTWRMGLYIPDDGGVDPAFAAPAIARGAQALGVKIITRCAARGFQTEGGVLSGVITELGEIKTSLCLLAGGSWSRLMLGNAGINLPVLPVYLSQQRLTGVAGTPPACGAAGRTVWRQEADGSYSNGPRFMTAPLLRDSFALLPTFAPVLPGMLASSTPLDFTIGSDLGQSFAVDRSWTMDEVTPFERHRVVAPSHNDGTLDMALDWLRTEFPAFNASRVIERWGGTVDVTTDEIPIAAPVPQIPGLFLTSAFTYGMTQGMGVGDLMADLMTGATPRIDPKPLAFDRFA